MSSKASVNYQQHTAVKQSRLIHNKYNVGGLHEHSSGS